MFYLEEHIEEILVILGLTKSSLKDKKYKLQKKIWLH
jgi:hypothetical protein